MNGKFSAKIWSKSTWVTRGKLIYNRITLSKLTASYFGLAFFICIIMVVLQSVTLIDNSTAVDLVSEILYTGNVTEGLTIAWPDGLAFCHNVPGEPNADCVVIRGTPVPPQPRGLYSVIQKSSFGPSIRRRVGIDSEVSPSGRIDGVIIDGSITLDMNCLQSLLWVDDIVRNARREDIVIIAFQIWLFSLAFFTLLNESLPHLIAAFLGHALGTAWAAFRVVSSQKLQRHYDRYIVQGTCGVNLMGDWWNVRFSHTIPITVMNGVVLLAMFFMTYKLFKVYAHQSLSRVGASSAIRKVYKLVLLLSVFLHLSSFFVLASTGIWIDKVTKGGLRLVAKHLPIYLITFAVNAGLLVPWVIMGWKSVRREHRGQFIVFAVLSLPLLAIPTSLFASPMYHFIFMVWPFFATMTVTSYIIFVITCAIGIVCRLHFGEGLAHFLQVADALADADFTPTIYIHYDSKTSSMISKSHIALPDLEKQKEADFGTLKHTIQLPQMAYQADSKRGQITSVYSDPTRATVKLSSTPRVAQTGSRASQATSFFSSDRSSIITTTTLATTRSSSIRRTVKLPPLPSEVMPTVPAASHHSSIPAASSLVKSNSERVGRPERKKPAPLQLNTDQKPPRALPLTHSRSISSGTRPDGNYF